ncbi:hypothetical protein N7466_004632 [Penicillium verhagenii]|uniref:uncharacterized protein n=1 Tax=Penicillium verhagenii TaxID=1562060 RepID=UPI0025451BB1|nr:uncharacterized protein N7466_004632 [Penicillium verhagenii]KAJ5935085.1 hypothetical protein N7466_004632 [Penicillium verhagenii]
MSNQPEFLILRQPFGWLSEDQLPRVLGSVVLNPHSPLSNSIPDSPPIGKNNISENKFTNFILNHELMNQNSTNFSVQGIGNFRRQHDNVTQLNINGKLIIAKRLTELRTFWKTMTDKVPKFADEVAEWVGERRSLGLRARYEVCWVVGVLICKDVSIASSSEQNTEFRARGDIPLGTMAQIAAAAHGVPLPTGDMGNASLERVNSGAQNDYFFANAEGGQIFAVEVLLIKSSRGRIQPTDNGPRGDKLGQDSDDDEVLPEDLELQELGTDDWNNLLQQEPIPDT